MLSLKYLSFCLMLASQGVHAYDKIIGYKPNSQVSDHAAIDLDQLKINEQIADRKIHHAMIVYQQGGHSFSYAELSLTGLTEAASFPNGTKVHGHTEEKQQNFETVEGRLMEPASWTDADSSATVKVQYHTKDSYSDYSNCQVGGLYIFAEANRNGCFAPAGNVTFVDSAGKKHIFQYSYDQRAGNKNRRTLQSFSTEAGEYMETSKGVDYPDFKLFLDYYGDAAYGDKWITSANEGVETSFTSGRGKSDFSKLSDRVGKGEAIKKGIAYLNVWMYVIKELYDGVDMCRTGEKYPDHAIDRAVAYYAGSLATQENSDGILLYALANVRATQARTAGKAGDKDGGVAQVNLEIVEEFKNAQKFLNATKCDDAEKSVQNIVNWMKVPLIQGVLRYAYIREYGDADLTTTDDKERIMTEGATFAATILPYVHKCDSKGAKIIHDNMRINNLGAKMSYSTVRSILEKHYDCLQVTCDQIGGIWDITAQDWKQNGSPCDTSSMQVENGSAVGAVLGVTVGVLVAGWLFLRYRRSRVTKRRKSLPEMYTGNIAAVTEIA